MGSTESYTELPEGSGLPAGVDLAELPALATNPRFIFFTDFDGTITQQDSNDFMTDNLGYGVELRKKALQDVLYGRRSFREAFTDMMDSIATPYDECIALLLKNITLDPYFKEFYAWARRSNIPVVVLSGGMRPVISALLGHLLGEEALAHLQIVSNDAAVREGHASRDEPHGWKVTFHDDSHFGHDKSIEIRKYADLPDGHRPVIFYAGDGVSDLSAAREADLMFAKAGMDLVTYCQKESIPYTEFSDFSGIMATVQAIVEGRLSVKDVARKAE